MAARPGLEDYVSLERVQQLTDPCFEPLFWTGDGGELLDYCLLKDRAIFMDRLHNADPRAAGHVTSCIQGRINHGAKRAMAQGPPP